MNDNKQPGDFNEKLDGYPNGEITFNSLTKQYTVWDETYTNRVCVTPYLLVASAALIAYGEHYL